MRRGRRALVITLGFVWGVLVTGGALALTAEAGRGAFAKDVPSTWVDNALVAKANGRPTVLVFIHPRCPCSRATLRELERDLVSAGGDDAAEIHVLFVQPHGTSAGFEKGPLWDQANAIRGVDVRVDEGGKLAARLGAVLSGHVLVFDANGKTTFAGGITPGRGHEGASAARQAFVAAIAKDHPAPASSASAVTFGCSLEKEK